MGLGYILNFLAAGYQHAFQSVLPKWSRKGKYVCCLLPEYKQDRNFLYAVHDWTLLRLSRSGLQLHQVFFCCIFTAGRTSRVGASRRKNQRVCVDRAASWAYFLGEPKVFPRAN